MLNNDKPISEIVALYNSTISDILLSIDKFKSFLQVAAKHYKHHSTNQLMIYAQAPKAHLVANEKVWEKLGGTISNVSSEEIIYSLGRKDAELCINKLYKAQDVTIDRVTLNEYMQEWTQADRDKIGLGEDIYNELYKMCSQNYDALYQDITVPVSRETCVELATAILMFKLGVDCDGQYWYQGFDEIGGMDKAFPKAIQWVNHLVIETYTPLEKGLKNHEREQQRAVRDIRQDGANLLGNKRAGSVERFAVGGQLTFEDFTHGDDHAARGEHSQRVDDATEKRRDTKSAKKPQRATVNLQSHQLNGAGNGDGEFNETSGNIGSRNKSQAAFVLQSPRTLNGTTGFEIDEFCIKAVLSCGAGERNSKHRIISIYSRDIPSNETIELIQHEFGRYAATYDYKSRDELGSAVLSLWTNENGVVLGEGKSALLASNKTFLQWSQVDEIYRQLAQKGFLYGETELADAHENEIKEFSEGLAYFYRDSGLAKTAPHGIYSDIFKSFPETVQAFSKLLKSYKMQDVVNLLQEDVFQYKNGAKKFAGNYVPYATIQRLEKAIKYFCTPVTEMQRGQSEVYYTALRSAAISEDAVDYFLSSHQFKQTLVSILDGKNTAERSRLLKEVYGFSGGSNMGLRDAEWGWAASGKGLGFYSHYNVGKADKRPIVLTWTEVTKRIESLVSEKRMITKDNVSELSAAGVYHKKGLPYIGKGFHVVDTEMLLPAKENPVQLQLAAIEQKEVETLAHELDSFYQDFDPYGYKDDVEDREQTFNETVQELVNGGEAVEHIKENLQEIVADDFKDENFVERAQTLLDKIEIYGGNKTKFKKNMKALKTLQVVEQEKRPLTEDERAALHAYTGWGGIPQVFDTRNEKWSRERQELSSVLNTDEYKQAMRTTINAHYTPNWLISEMWLTLNKLGISNGRILDPSTGNGRFFEELPPSWNCELYGVELDNVSGRITQQLYPQANIQIKGYQETLFPESFFDAVISNVPFGNYSVYDPNYKGKKWAIHEYFFGKSLDVVKPGGVVAFITSKYLMDKKSNTMRKYIAERAELVTAVRLPSNTFKGIANTEVTTDMIVLRKREQPIVADNERWIHIGLTDNGVPVNEYYLDNPQHMLGEMQYCADMYGNEKDTACVSSYTEEELAGKLHQLTESIEYHVESDVAPETETPLRDSTCKPETDMPPLEIPADPCVKNYTYTLREGHLYYRDNAAMVYQDGLTSSKLERIVGMIAIREALKAVIECQTDERRANNLEQCQTALNATYDEYVHKYGYLNTSSNDIAFKEDVERPLLQSLEIPVGEGEYAKADIFSKRTIYPQQTPVITSATDALIASLNYRGMVDIAYMSSIYEKAEDVIIKELGDLIFLNPETNRYESAEEYLSGNVREKYLAAVNAAAIDTTFERNRAALLKVQPKPLNLVDISFDLSSEWISEEIRIRFLYDVMKVPGYAKDKVLLVREPGSLRYSLKGKSLSRSACAVMATEVYGLPKYSGFQIFEDCLNLQISTVYNYYEEDGKKKKKLNAEQTQLVRAKQAALQAEFKTWAGLNTDVAEELERVYNERFNIYIPRKYDGSWLTFEGMSSQITLRAHQKNAVARILLGGNTLLAHEVGSGKTFTMAAACMKKKMAGLCSKSLFAIPNHMLEQWTKEFYQLYPNANLLVTTRRDFEKSNRQRFIARIATGEYDAVVMTFTQFERIAMSPEYRSEMIMQEIDEITEAMEDAEDKDYSVKRMEATKIKLEERLKELADESKKDDVIYFEQLGIDQLFVDEAHYYKNCYVHTKINGVAGLGTSRAEKAFDMLMKASYLNEKTDERGVVFATGTPITNSLSEMFVNQRYLQKKALLYSNISQFDQWASTYASIESVLEIAPEGTGFRDRMRFTKFNNLPELINMFHLVADVVLVEDLPDIQRPQIVGGKPEVVVVPASPFVETYIEELAERADKVRRGLVEPHEDNMLLITMHGRNVAIDPRLVYPDADVQEDSKIYAVCKNILQLYHQYNEERGVQCAFQDVGIQLYPVMKEYLIENGIPENEIAFIHDAKTDKQKAELFKKCRAGDVRVIFGSTAKMGTGTNIQKRLIGLHDIDCPWRPSDVGRILRTFKIKKNVEVTDNGKIII